MNPFHRVLWALIIFAIMAGASLAEQTRLAEYSYYGDNLTLSSDTSQNHYVLHFSDRHGVNSNLEYLTPAQAKVFRVAYNDAKKRVAAIKPGQGGYLFSSSPGKTRVAFDFSANYASDGVSQLVIRVTNKRTSDKNTLVVPIVWTGQNTASAALKKQFEALLQETNY